MYALFQKNEENAELYTLWAKMIFLLLLRTNTVFLFTGNQMTLGGGTIGVTTSDQTNLHTDSLPNTLNKLVPVALSYY